LTNHSSLIAETMGSLYDDSIFARREEAARQRARKGNRLFLIVIVLAVLAVAGIAGWRWWSSRQPINVNTASVEQLQAIPDVGPAIAKAIVKGRPYATPEDLKKVPGIGDKTFENMRARVRVE
jgi:competence protein ComEA